MIYNNAKEKVKTCIITRVVINDLLLIGISIYKIATNNENHDEQNHSNMNIDINTPR